MGTFFSSLFEKMKFNLISWKFALLGVVLPSLLYLCSSLYFSPLRTLNITVLTLIVLSGAVINRFVFFFLLSTAMLLDLAVFAAHYFQMPLTMLWDSTQYVDRLDLVGFGPYFFVLIFFFVSLIGTYRVTLYARRRRAELSFIPLMLVMIVYVCIDWLINQTPQEKLSLRSFWEPSFTSVRDTATNQVGLEAVLKSERKPNILIVMVEGLGAFEDAYKQDLIWGPLLSSEIRGAYEVDTGTAAYFGTTTSAEARELCQLKADYRDFRERDNVACLPQLAKQAGYQTGAFHAFTGTFFERFDWYPKIGFEGLNFLESNGGLPLDVDVPECGLTFKGLCDTDIARAVKGFLRQETSQPKFAYWLTFNSHKPVGVGEVPERLDCEAGGVFKDRELCLMGEHWLNISYLVKEIALMSRLRGTEFLLVGDHHPPLFTRHGRNQFQPERVAWLHLKPVKQKTDQLAAVKDRNSM